MPASNLLHLLVDSGLKGTLPLAAALLLTTTARRLSAAHKHALWTTATVSLLALPLLSLALPPLAIPTPKILTANDAPIPIAAAATPITHAPGAAPSDLDPPLPLIENRKFKTENPSPSAPGRPFTVARLLPATYLLPAAALLLPLLLAPLRTRRFLRRHPSTPAPFPHRLPVAVLLNDGLHMPVALGLLRPRILLPAAAAHWPPGRRRAVLLHELAHLQRRDLHTQALAHLARALFWFHPLVWIACRQMSTLREAACDDRVLAHGIPPAAYAQTLFDIATCFQRSPLMRTSAVSMARPSTLESRIRSILSPTSTRRPLSRTTLAALILAALTLSLSLAPLSAADTPTPPPAATTPAAPTPTTPAPTPTPAAPPTVTLLAIAPNGTGPFWTPDGSPTIFPENSVGGVPPGRASADSRWLFIRVPNTAGAPLATLPQGAPETFLEVTSVTLFKDNTLINKNTDACYAIVINRDPAKLPFPNLRIGVPIGDWQTLDQGKIPPSGATPTGRYVTGNLTEGAYNDTNHATLPDVSFTIAHNLPDELRALAIDNDGREHAMEPAAPTRQGTLQQFTATFTNLSLAQVKTFRLETRKIEWTTFKNVPLNPSSAKPADTPPPALPSATNAADAADIAAEIAVREAQLRELHKQGLNDNHPHVVELLSQIQTLRHLQPPAHATLFAAGSFKKPGVYELEHPTLRNLLAAAALNEPHPDTLMIRLIHRVDSLQENTRYIPYAFLQSHPDLDPALQNNDLVNLYPDDRIAALIAKRKKLADDLAAHNATRSPTANTPNLLAGEIRAQLADIEKQLTPSALTSPPTTP